MPIGAGIGAANPTDTIPAPPDDDSDGVDNSAGGGIDATGAAFIPPFILDPNHPTHLLAGSQVVSLTQNATAATPAWSVISPSHATGSDSISALALAAGDATGNTVYAGTAQGQVWVTTNALAAPPSWIEITHNLPSGRKITSITTDGAATPAVFVSVSGFGPANGAAFHVAKLPPAAGTWTDLSANLPNAPANVARLIAGRLYTGTDAGVFASSDGCTAWSVMTGGLLFVQVIDLVYQSPASGNGGTLLTLTHGRGAWSLTLPPASPGVLRVTTNPTLPSKVVIDGIPRDFWALTWLELPAPASYSVSFTAVSGFAAPARKRSP